MTFELRPYQHAAVSAILADLAEHRAVAAIMPTGSGKTEVFIETAQRLLEADDEAACLVLSHVGLLTDQTAERFTLRRPHLPVGVLQAKRKPEWNSRVIISTMQTSRDLAHVELLKKRCNRKVKFIFVDEMQMLPTPSYETVRSHFPEAKLVGFTATPFRGNRIMTGFVDKVSFSISMQDVIDMGYLVPPRVFDMPKLRDAADVMATVLGLYKAHEAGNGAIVFMRSVADAKSLKLAFDEERIHARAVTQELSAVQRRDLLKDFNDGKIDVLTTVNVLTAGFDSPRVRAVFMPYGASSPTAYIQRVGRSLRPDRATGKVEGRVYVAGDAPGVSSKTYERLTAKILTAGGSPRDTGSYRGDLDMNDYDPKTEIYVFTETVVNAVKRFEKLGMEHFAAMLDSKLFPPRFLHSIGTLIESLPNKKSTLPGGTAPATDNQKTYLFRAGFGSSQLTGISKAEASTMISALVNMTGRKASDTPRYIVSEGTHRGKHVSELPHAYRSLVKKRYPDSPVAKEITAWEEAQRRTG